MQRRGRQADWSPCQHLTAHIPRGRGWAGVVGHSAVEGAVSLTLGSPAQRPLRLAQGPLWERISLALCFFTQFVPFLLVKQSLRLRLPFTYLNFQAPGGLGEEPGCGPPSLNGMITPHSSLLPFFLPSLHLLLSTTFTEADSERSCKLIIKTTLQKEKLLLKRVNDPRFPKYCQRQDSISVQPGSNIIALKSRTDYILPTTDSILTTLCTVSRLVID